MTVGRVFAYRILPFFYRIVKLTSPKLNYIVLLGAFMLYTSVYFYVLPSTQKLTSTVYCHVSTNVYCFVVHGYESKVLCMLLHRLLTRLRSLYNLWLL